LGKEKEKGKPLPGLKRGTAKKSITRKKRMLETKGTTKRTKNLARRNLRGHIVTITMKLDVNARKMRNYHLLNTRWDPSRGKE